MTEGWRYVLSAQALRDKRRLTLSARQRIFAALDLYVAQHRGDVLKLRGRDEEWRLRVGDRRIPFHPNFQDRVVVVVLVLPAVGPIAGERRRDTMVRTKKATVPVLSLPTSRGPHVTCPIKS